MWLVRFDPAVGAEIQKLRPAVVMSPATVGLLPLRIVVPITDWKSRYATRIWFVYVPATTANGLSKDSGADAFQAKSLSLNRFVRKLGALLPAEVNEVAAAVALCVGYI